MTAHTSTSATLATLSCVTILSAAACGGSDNGQQPAATMPAATTTTPYGPTTTTYAPTAAPPPAQAGPPTITIFDFVFNEFNDVVVSPDAQVTVTNTDEDPHTVTSYTPGAFDIDIAAKSEATFTAPSQPGSYPFHCGNHTSMHGTLIVQ
jgi:plastocyanin